MARITFDPLNAFPPEVEALAKSICRERGIEPDTPAVFGHLQVIDWVTIIPDPSLLAPAWRGYVDLARAVLRAQASLK